MERRSYGTDLTNGQWKILEPLLPKPVKLGRPNEYSPREIINGIYYITKAGCSWRLLPHDLPPWWTVYHYFRLWSRNGTWKTLNDTLRRAVRIQDGRDSEPSAASIDSQSTKTTEGGEERGYDGGKKINGRKRHILVDVPQLDLVWADGAYAGELVEEIEAQKDFQLEIIKRTDDMKGFVLLPKRWVVERTFGWLSRCRRLSKDYERTTPSSTGFVYAAMTRLMLRRLA